MRRREETQALGLKNLPEVEGKHKKNIFYAACTGRVSQKKGLFSYSGDYCIMTSIFLRSLHLFI